MEKRNSVLRHWRMSLLEPERIIMRNAGAGYTGLPEDFAGKSDFQTGSTFENREGQAD